MEINKKFFSSVLGLVLVAATMVSCELTTLKEPSEVDQVTIFEPEVFPQTMAEYRAELHGETSKKWTNTTFTLGGMDGFQDCRLDDTININGDGTYTYDGGDILCGAEDNEQSRTGTWEIINGGANIIFDKGTEREYEANVTGLQDNTLAIEGKYLGLTVKGIYSAK